MGRSTAADRIVGFNIRKIRVASGLSADQLAGMLRITAGQLESFEGGRTRISAVLLTQLADLTGHPPSTFFAGVLDTDPDG